MKQHTKVQAVDLHFGKNFVRRFPQNRINTERSIAVFLRKNT